MKDYALNLLANERLIEATHWTVFALGALSLSVAVSGTVWTAFFV